MLRGHSCSRTAAAPPIPLLVLAALLFCLRPADAAGNGPEPDLSFPRCDTLTLSDSTLQLRARFVAPGTLVLTCDSSVLRDSLYSLDPAAGMLRFHGLPPGRTILARYRALPFAYPLSYSLRQPVHPAPAADSSAVARVDSLPAREKSLGGADISEGFRLVGFDIRGAKSVSVSGGGSTGGTLLDQNLMLEVSGKLSPSTRLALRLNDQDLPLSPEGRSAELRELDEVSVRLSSPYGNVSLGDYDFRLDGFRFARVERKLDGVAGEYAIAGAQVAASAALSGGTFNSLRFNAQEGRQGPYQLTGRDGAPARVLAGTERVYLDGNLLSRGLRSDYTIDYTQGTLYFTERHLLGAESRIEVDYEYTSLSFRKSFFSLTGAASGRMGGVRGYFIRESDLESSPLGQDFTPEEERYLAGLGVSADSLQLSGIRFLGAGKGVYRIHGESTGNHWFEYLGPGRGEYMLTFRDAGDYRGSYVFDSSTGGYTYVGEGLGNFEPIGRFNPPQREDRAGAAFELAPLPHLRLEGEGAVLSREVNLFSGSSLPAALAHSLSLHVDTLPAAVLPARLSLWGAESRVDRAFTFQGRRYGPDFERLWHLVPLPDGESANSGVGESQRESGARLDLPWGLAASLGWGELSRTSGERADRREYGLEIRPDKLPLDASWRRLNIHSRRLGDTTAASGAGPGYGYRKRDNLEVRSTLGRFTPRLTLEREESTGPAGLYVNAAGERHLELRPRLAARLGPRLETALSFYRRGNDYLPSAPTRDWLRESTVQAAEADFNYQGAGAFRLSGRLGHRTREYRREVQARTSSDAGRLEMFAGSFDGALQSHLLYEISHGASVRSQVRYLPERYPDEGEYLEEGTYVGRAQGTHRREVIVGGIDPQAAATLSLTSRENLDLTAWVDTSGRHVKRMTVGSTVQLERENTAVEAWKLYLLAPSALNDKAGAVMRATLINTDLSVQWANPGIYSRLELLWNSRFDRRFESGYEESAERSLRLQLRIPLATGLQWDPTPAWSRRLRTNLGGGSRTVRSLSLENRLTWDLSRQWRLTVEQEAASHRVLGPDARYGRYSFGGTLARFLGGSGRVEVGARAWRVTGNKGEDVLLVDILGLAGAGTGYETTAGVSVEPAERMLIHVRYTGRTDYLRRKFTNFGRAEIKYLF